MEGSTIGAMFAARHDPFAHTIFPMGAEVTISKVDVVDLPQLLPLIRAYLDFYEVIPRDDRVVALCRTLIDDPGEGVQLIARDEETAEPVGFATVYWTWSTLDAMRIGLMNDLFVVPGRRGSGIGGRLIEACRGACRKRGAGKLVWDTAPDNQTARRLYEATGASSSTWVTYEIEAW
jgi:GNAT superfamily N-acetyltransferase